MLRSEIINLLQIYMKDLRQKSARISNLQVEKTDVLFTEIRSSYDMTDESKRLVVFLRGTGCSRIEDVGGCTFCGFYNATSYGNKISNYEYLAQLHKVLTEHTAEVNNCKTICLYNDGSMLCEREISFSALIEMLMEIEKLKQFNRVVIESKIEDINKYKLEMISKMFKNKIDIAVGFESAHPLIRDICVNKSFSAELFESNVLLAKGYGISIVPLIMIKPPFLTENESIQDALMSLIYLERFQLERIDFELPTVENNTLMKKLWDDGLYQPVMLWSVVEILKFRERLKLTTPIYISPMSYSVQSLASAKNCEKCTSLFLKELESFNKINSLENIKKIECNCKNDWEKLINTPPLSASLFERCYNYLNKLEG